MIAFVALACIRRSFAIHDFGVSLATRFPIMPRGLRSQSSQQSPASADVLRGIVSTGPGVEEDNDYDEQESSDSDLSFRQDKRTRTGSQLRMTPVASANAMDVDGSNDGDGDVELKMTREQMFAELTEAKWTVPKNSNKEKLMGFVQRKRSGGVPPAATPAAGRPKTKSNGKALAGSPASIEILAPLAMQLVMRDEFDQLNGRDERNTKSAEVIARFVEKSTPTGGDEVSATFIALASVFVTGHLLSGINKSILNSTTDDTGRKIDSNGIWCFIGTLFLLVGDNASLEIDHRFSLLSKSQPDAMKMNDFKRIMSHMTVFLDMSNPSEPGEAWATAETRSDALMTLENSMLSSFKKHLFNPKFSTFTLDDDVSPTRTNAATLRSVLAWMSTGRKKDGLKFNMLADSDFGLIYATRGQRVGGNASKQIMNLVRDTVPNNSNSRMVSDNGYF